jgi:multidrug efflux pump subunit AcrA (membrane-fusion protein)
LQISATIAEYDVIKVQNGMAAHVSSNAIDNQVFEGVVDFVAPVASDTNGNFLVRVVLTSPPGELRPGMTATIEIVTAGKQNVFAVPIDAVVKRPDGQTVVYAYELGIGGGPRGGVVSGDGQTPPTGDGGGTSAPQGLSSTDGNLQVTTDNRGAAFVAGANYTRREIEVTTGMDTDYYIEIAGAGLTEGMLLLTDPLGKNVVEANAGQFGGMMGVGGVGPVRAETVTVGSGAERPRGSDGGSGGPGGDDGSVVIN